MMKVGTLRGGGPDDLKGSDSRLCSHLHREPDAHQLMRIVNLRIRAQLRVEKTILVQESCECFFRAGKARGIERIFIWEIDHLEKARIREGLPFFSKIAATEIIGRLQEKANV